MSTLVSIIVPTYNRANLLLEAVDSVRQQTFENWELLIVDDGSSDETGMAVKEFLGDTRIHYLWQENRGQSAARNRGLLNSQGSLVAFLDSDNRWLPHKLSSQAAFMESHPEVDVLYGETERIGSDGSTWPSPNRRRYSGIIWRHLLDQNFVNFNTSIVRRHKLVEVGGFDEDLRGGEDYDLWLRLSRDSVFHFLPGVVTQYRIEGDRITNSLERVMDANLASLNAFFRKNADLIGWSEKRTAKGRLHERFARSYSSSGELFKGLKLGMKAIAYAPFSTRAWWALAAVCISPFRRRELGRVKSGGKQEHE